ncbi:MAG: PepSY-associated TM helix domain-containing protein [Cyclobacteriaceae bacterium]
MVKIDSKNRSQIKQISHQTRDWRKVHHYFGLAVALFLLISSITGILLSLKKDVEIIQPPTQKGGTKNMAEWKAMHELEEISTRALTEHLGYLTELDRVDIRPDKGVAKFQYLPGYWEVQVDGSSGEVLMIEKRYSDLIEKIHDGSIISDLFKLVSMNLLGFGVIVMIATGLWLWYGPFKIRKLKKLR